MDLRFILLADYTGGVFPNGVFSWVHPGFPRGFARGFQRVTPGGVVNEFSSYVGGFHGRCEVLPGWGLSTWGGSSAFVFFISSLLPSPFAPLEGGGGFPAD